MPIYEYRCSACGHHMEILQRVQDRPPRKCPDCGGKLAKQHSRTAFVLKGGGWYAHGYAKSADAARKAPAASDSGAAPDKPKKPAGGASADGSKGSSGD